MTETMERTRMIFDTDEVHRRAVKLYAARHGISTSEVVNRAIAELCDRELEEARETAAKEAKKKPRPD